MIKPKKKKRSKTLKEAKGFCKEFDFTAGMLKGMLPK